MTTNNSCDVGLAGSTGTGNFVGANTPTLITPVLGAATATSVNFGASATTNGIIGVTGGTTASAGVVGQLLSSQIVANGTAISSNSPTTLTSVVLSAGDWDVGGNITFIASGNVLTTAIAGIFTTNNTLPDASLYSVNRSDTATSSLSTFAPTYIFNVSGNTTIYLVGDVTLSSGTCTQCGFLWARRVR